MDLKSLGIGLIMILCVIAPFYILLRNAKRRKNKLAEILSQLAAQNNTEAGEAEFWSSSAIAMSCDEHYLFSVRAETGENITSVIYLKEYSRCKVVVNSHKVKGKDGDVDITDEIKLEFYADGNQTPCVLVLYKAGSDSSFVNGELQLAERWKKKISAIR